MRAFLSSSDETVFGNIFFEALAQAVAVHRGARTSSGVGVDIEYDDDRTNTVIAVKSSPNIQNASAQSKQNDEFITIRNIKQKTGKAFDAVLGFCYGRATGTPKGKIYRRAAGQAFWAEISGDEDCYLDILRAMGETPDRHKVEYETRLSQIANKIELAFSLNFVDQDGLINWPKLLEYNSGAGTRMTLISASVSSADGEDDTDE